MLKAPTSSTEFENDLYFVNIWRLNDFVYNLSSIYHNDILANSIFAYFIKEYFQLITLFSRNVIDSIKRIEVFINFFFLIGNPINPPLWTHLVILLYFVFEILHLFLFKQLLKTPFVCFAAFASALSFNTVLWISLSHIYFIFYKIIIFIY